MYAIRSYYDIEQLNLQLSRELRPLPTMKLNPEIKNIFDFTFDDFTLEGYRITSYNVCYTKLLRA